MATLSGVLTESHAVLVHPMLCFSGQTERMVATALALEGQGHRVSIVSTPGTRASAVQQLGFTPFLAELPANPWRAPFASLRTLRLLKRLKPDTVHATADSLAPLMACIAPRLGVPWIQEFHAPVTRPSVSNRANFASAIVNSASLIESVVNRGGIPRHRVRTIKNAPAPSEFAHKYIPFKHSGLPQIGCSGLLDNEHATSWFLEAVRLMVLSGTRAMFVIFGEGPNDGALRRFIRDKGLNKHVTLAVPTTKSAAESLGALDIHVSCKLEGGPGWLACQALAQAIPSIFIAAGDAYELIEDKSNGILIEPNNPRRLADELTLLCTQQDRARRMGERGKARLEETAPFKTFEEGVVEAHALALASD